MLFSSQSILITDLWTNDLLHVGYDDIPTIHRYNGFSSPCIGKDALFGVYFHPAVKYTQSTRSPKVDK